jgi:hypothetical protein
MYYSNDPQIPNLSGCICTALSCEDTWHKKGRYLLRFHAFYLQLNGKHWHRFRVNCGGVSWKVVNSPIHPQNEHWEFRLNTLEDEEIIGNRIHKIEYWQREPFHYDPNDDLLKQSYDDSAIRLQFVNGLVVQIRNQSDEKFLDSFHLTPNQARRKNHYERAELLDTNG